MIIDSLQEAPVRVPEGTMLEGSAVFDPTVVSKNEPVLLSADLNSKHEVLAVGIADELDKLLRAEVTSEIRNETARKMMYEIVSSIGISQASKDEVRLTDVINLLDDENKPEHEDISHTKTANLSAENGSVYEADISQDTARAWRYGPEAAYRKERDGVVVEIGALIDATPKEKKLTVAKVMMNKIVKSLNEDRALKNAPPLTKTDVMRLIKNSEK